VLVVSDAAGHPVRWIDGPAKAGLHRVHWNLRGPAPDPVDLSTPGFTPPWSSAPQGPLMAPGRYSVALAVVSSDGVRPVGAPQTFELKPVPNAPPRTDFAAVAAFQQQTAELMRRVAGAGMEIGAVRERLRYMRAALLQTPRAAPGLFARLDSLARAVGGLQARLNGDPARQRLNEATAPSIRGRVGLVVSGHWDTRQTPTATQRRNVELATAALASFARDLGTLIDRDVARLEADLEAAGAPWTPGRRLPAP
jgi:hypothetical protein